MNVDVHIERLVLDGVRVDAHESEMLANALRAELGQLLTHRQVSVRLLSGPAIPVLHADPVRPGAPVAPKPLGQQIARAVYGAIGE